MSDELDFFSSCPKGLENLLEQELTQLGATVQRQTVAGVHYSASIAISLRVCLWSRLANKVLLPLTQFMVTEGDDLYTGASKIDWHHHLNPNSTIAVDFIGTNGGVRNTQFGALKVKDAIVDVMRQQCGSRPSVDKNNPDIRIHARLHRNEVTVSLDLSGESLHRRGYRQQMGGAPLKENLAAGLLVRSDWPAIAQQGGALLDPMCGSATFLIEAGLMAADIAPGLRRASFGFEHWLNHQNDQWLSLREEAIERKNAGLAADLPEIRGYDANLRQIRGAEQNIVAAGLDHWLRVTRKELRDFKVPTHKHIKPGLIICNPPYGERLGEVESLKVLYRHMGEVVKREFDGWKLGVFTGNPQLSREMALRNDKKYKFFNGAIPCELLLSSISQEFKKADTSIESDTESNNSSDSDNPWIAAKQKLSSSDQPAPREASPTTIKVAATDVPLTPGAEMVANRLKKNLKQRAKWAKKNAIQCYRVYDADMPEYSAAIDVYGDYVHVQEYQAPKSVDEKKAHWRFEELQQAVASVLQSDTSKVSYKQRRRNKGRQQYERFDEQRNDIVVTEGQAQLQVNLWKYLDTGLFLDHRPIRLKIADMAKGKRFLNLFCYTATASVHAALGGAKFSLSVDMSHTYLNWARKNLATNGLSESVNRLEQADCLEWLQQAAHAVEQGNGQQFDMILLDPPSFSNSKRMEGVLDVQRDHADLIQQAMTLLAPEGTLIFSNNLRSFRLDESVTESYRVTDYTQQSIDQDFQRNTKIHQCWFIQH